MSLTGYVEGTPVQQGSSTPGQRKDGSLYVRPNAGRRLKTWRVLVAESVKGSTVRGPVVVRVRFMFTKPARTKFPDYPAGRPDIDKVLRALLDGLTTGGAFEDDARVVRVEMEKVWAEPGATPGVEWEVSPR